MLVAPLISTVPVQAAFFHHFVSFSPSTGEGTPPNTTVPEPVTAAEAEDANVPLATSVPFTTKPPGAVAPATVIDLPDSI